MTILWDCTRKPIFDEMYDKKMNIEGQTVEVACFPTVPFEDIEEYVHYNNVLNTYIKTYKHSPINKKDYDVYKSML